MPDFITPFPMLVFWIVFGYLLGSIPFGLIITDKLGLGDVRKIGSGNIGTTNVLRTGSKKAAALTLLGDALKGTIAVWIAMFSTMTVDAIYAVALAVFLGHCFPVWLNFKGGKGVATFIGIWLGISLNMALAIILVWLITAALSRYSSLSALVAAAASPVLTIVFGTWADYGILALLLAALVFIRHRENIERLRDGTESKIGEKKADKA